MRPDHDTLAVEHRPENRRRRSEQPQALHDMPARSEGFFEDLDLPPALLASLTPPPGHWQPA
jgi:hypothetical protein